MMNTLRNTVMALAVVTFLAQPAAANEARDLVAAFYGMAGAEEADALGPLFADDFVDHDRLAQVPAELSDKGVMVGLFDQVAAGFPDARHALDTMAPIGEDLVVVYWRFAGTHTGPFFGAAASGDRLDVNGVEVFRARAGVLVERWHVDGMTALFEPRRAR